MISGAGSLIIEERHTRGVAVFIRKIYPHPVLGGSLLVRFADHLDPGLVTVDVPAFQKFLLHPVIQRFQVTVRTADDPVGHGFGGKVQIVSSEFPFLPCQRHSVHILGIHDPGHQGRCRDASPGNQRRDFLRPLHGTAFRAAVNIGHFLHHLEFRRNEFQTFHGLPGNNLVLFPAVRTVTVFSGQLVLNGLGDFKAGEIFFLLSCTLFPFIG